MAAAIGTTQVLTPPPQPATKTEVGLTSPQPPTKTEVGLTSPQPPTKTEVGLASPQLPTKTELVLDSPQLPTKTEVGLASPQPATKTQVGLASPSTPPPNPPSQRPSGPAALKATVMGMGMTPPPASVATAKPPPQPAASPTPAAHGSSLQFKGTMIGMGASPPATPARTAATPGNPPAAAPSPAPGHALRGTMIGMAPPTPTPHAQTPASAPTPAPGIATPAATPGPTDLNQTVDISRTPLGRKTMVGIARPGIAPLNPGVQKVPSDPPAAAGWPSTTLGAGSSAPPTLVQPQATEAIAGLPRPFRIPATAALAIVGAAALLTAAGVALLLFRARGAVEATLGTGADGRDQLLLTCGGCPDGSTVSVGAARGTFRAGRAEVPLGQKLAVGENAVSVELERRPGKVEQVELKVPVDFRVRADTSGLAQIPPRVIVRVEAVPQTAAVVDGKPLALTAAPGGTEVGSAEIDIAKALSGSSSVVGLLERKIPYVVTPPSGSPTRGDVSVRVGVTPLVVQAPGPSIVVESATFVLAGHTGKDATVTVEGRPITVDASGAFAQMMSVSSLGETNITVRADAKDQAPRLVPVRVRRVQSLTAEAALVRATATTSYAAIARDPESQRGLAVALDGSVVEARTDAFTSVLLLDVKSGCPSAPCLARVTVGEKTQLKDGANVSAFGTITGAVDGPHQGTRIPTIAADFVLKGRP
jgi:hypothetical protein